MQNPQYYFTEEEYKSSLMVSHNVATNSENALSCLVNNVPYALFEKYCKTPSCKCAEVFMEWVEVGPSNPHVIDFVFDYQTHEISEASQSVPKEIRLLLKKADFTSLLKRRNLAMRTAFRLFCEEKKARKNDFASNDKNIGRNDPCFCGSGKKYKKCCGA